MIFYKSEVFWSQKFFLIIASDGFRDLFFPLQVVRLIGEHMYSKVTLIPLKLTNKLWNFQTLRSINAFAKKRSVEKKPLDSNTDTHLRQIALKGIEYRVDHLKILKMLTLPSEVWLFRDDCTVTVVYINSEFLRHWPQ